MMQNPPSRPASAQGTGWEVVDQVATTDADAQGRVTRGIRISFKTAQGVVGSVFLPEARYSVENARAAIAAAAYQLDQVHQLRG